MKRIFDLSLSSIILIIMLFPMIVITIFIRLSSLGPALYWSNRVGKHNKIIKMPKFRSMFVDTPPIASHLLENSDDYLTVVGRFLRRYSLDELPQLISVIKGDMSLVGPRPALFNQDDLIALRVKKGVDSLLPGITGWAQVNGRDELSIYDKVELDEKYLYCQSFWFDIKILWMPLLKVIKRENILH